MAHSAFYIVAGRVAGRLALVLAFATGRFADAAENRPDLPDLGAGVAYRQIVDTNGPLSIHVLQVERGRPDLFVAASVGKAIKGKETVPAMAASFPGPGSPLAAVNGGFFEVAKQPRFFGVPSGLSIVNGELLHGPKTTSLCFDAGGAPTIRRVAAKFSVAWPDGRTTAVGLNCPTADYESSVKTAAIVLFTPRFGPSTGTTNGVRELVLGPADEGPWLPLRAGREYEVRVVEVSTSGNTAIASNAMVLSISRKEDASAPAVRAGDRLRISTAFDRDMTDVAAAVNGEPHLLVTGQAPPQLPDPPGARAPRTLVGYNATNLFFVVVDGRRPGLSAGMSFAEAAVFMHRLGCEEAVALDGGGSSTFWLAGQVKNSPSDGQPRAVADCLIVARRAEGATPE